MWRIRISIKLRLLAFLLCLPEFCKAQANDDSTTARGLSTTSTTSSYLRAGILACDCSSLVEAATAAARVDADESAGTDVLIWIVLCTASLAVGCCLGGAVGWSCFRQRRSRQYTQIVAPAPGTKAAEVQTLPQVMAELGVGKQLPVDLVCCLDSSASVGKDAFLTSVSFVRDIVEKLEMPNSSVGVLAFHHEIIQAQKLPLTDDKEKVMDHLDNLSFEAGETRLAKPLRLAAGMLTSHERPKNRRKIILVVTDGDPNDPADARRAADDLKGIDVELFVVQAGEADDPTATCALATTSQRSRLLVELKSYELLHESSTEVLQKLLDVSLYVRRAKCAVNLECYKEVNDIRMVRGIDMMVTGWEAEGEGSWNWEYHSEKVIYDPKTRPWDLSLSQPLLPALPPGTPPFTKTEEDDPGLIIDHLREEMQRMHEMQHMQREELLRWKLLCLEGDEVQRTLFQKLEDESQQRQKNAEEYAAKLRKLTDLKTDAESQIDTLQDALDALKAAHRQEIEALKAKSLEETKRAYQEAMDQLKAHHDAQRKQEDELHGKTVEGMKKTHEVLLSKTSLEAEVKHLNSIIAERDKHAKDFQAEINKSVITITEKERIIETLEKELAESKKAVPADVGTSTESAVATQTRTESAAATQTPGVVATQTSGVFGSSAAVVETQTSGVFEPNAEFDAATQTSAAVGTSTVCAMATQTPPHVLAELAMGGQRPVDIVCCLDSSASVGCDGFEKSVSFFRHILDQLEMPNSDAGLLTFHHDCTLVSRLTGDKNHLLQCLTNIHFEPGETNLAVPLKRAAEMLTHSDRSKDRRKIILVVTDGDPNDLKEVTKTAADLKAVSGLELCFVLVGKAMNFQTFSSLASTSVSGGLLLHKLGSYDELPLSSSAVLEKVLEVYQYVRRAKYVIDLSSYEDVDDDCVCNESERIGPEKGIDIPGWQAPGWQAVCDVSAETGYDIMIPGWQTSDNDSWSWKPCPRQVLLDAKARPWQRHTEHALSMDSAEVEGQEMSTPGVDARVETADDVMSLACQEKLPACMSAQLAGVNVMGGATGQPHSTHLLSALPELFATDLARIKLMDGSTVAPVGEGRSHLLSALPPLFDAHLAGINDMREDDGSTGAPVEEGRSLLLSALPELFSAQLAGINEMKDPACDVEEAGSTGTTDDFAIQQAMMDDFKHKLQLLRHRRVDPSTE